jgi:hypothetical protein
VEAGAGQGGGCWATAEQSQAGGLTNMVRPVRASGRSLNLLLDWGIVLAVWLSDRMLDLACSEVLG